MANSETGWTTEWPNGSDAFYWMRDSEGRYRDRPVHVTDDKLLGLFDHSYFNRRDIEGQVEFLGPIYASDAEQLSELRKALLGVRNGMGCWCKTPFVNISEDRPHEPRCLAVLAALNPDHSQGEKVEQQ